ncbi:hypothetical protein ABL78_3147 [Leptomonas seymouri]|uniref:EF-hand domain-containing protein n=1 Tax=Leptomonas seymouri TaxID=5684 RepID=A0A0N0P6M5_LEPSE|nr:hypothetical protein ABL78_3147 [Leptomonas seymouri]|eukprot:KPI87789.1 hypothetical protein ABL78_3147 [Leptomonas seymouri]
MSFARCAVLLSAGIAVGAGSAPYLCNTAPDPLPPSQRLPVLKDPLDKRKPNGVHALQHEKFLSTSASTDTATEHAHFAGADICVVASTIGNLSRLWGVAVGGAAQVGAAVMGGARRTAVASSQERTTTPASGKSTVAEPAADTKPLRNAPRKLKERFLHYAQRNPKSGEFVLTLEGFVRCMLLLPETVAEEEEPAHAPFLEAGHDMVMSAESRRVSQPSSWLQRFPPAVQRRFIHFFHCVDLDGTKEIDYAEFVVLFTFLSTRRQTLERAFRVFDLDDSGRLSEREFCRLLNTVMADPAVQVRYAPLESRGEGKGGEGRGEGSSGSIASRASELRSSERQRQKHKNDLKFEISSDVIRPLLFGPLPRHVGAPPGSTHCNDFSAPPAWRTWTLRGSQGGSTASAEDGGWREESLASRNQMTPAASSSAADAPVDVSASASWWRGAARKVMQSWPQPWRNEPAQLSSSAASSLGFALPSWLSELQQMAELDTLLETVSYPSFLYRMDYLRWELRAIEFGLCDPSNNGFISVEDFRTLLRRDCRAVLDGTKPITMHETAATAGKNTTAAAQPAGTALRPASVTWQEYQKLFDVIKESNVILQALKLMLDSLPPVPEDVLSGGAIPDDELRQATLAVQAVVQQTVLRYNNSTRKKEAHYKVVQGLNKDTNSGDTKPVGDAAVDDGTAAAVSDEAAAQGRYNEERFGLSANRAGSPEEKQKRARRLQATLVRPTALTWKQFGQALTAIDTVPRLSVREEALLRALINEGASDSLTPSEFARLCTMKETFFADHLPRFDKPQRNPVQQFFFCMQQLD